MQIGTTAVTCHYAHPHRIRFFWIPLWLTIHNLLLLLCGVNEHLMSNFRLCSLKQELCSSSQDLGLDFHFWPISARTETLCDDFGSIIYLVKLGWQFNISEKGNLEQSNRKIEFILYLSLLNIAVGNWKTQYPLYTLPAATQSKQNS